MSKDTKGAWLPPERMYSILFELEQVESRTGQYPSTEGFLQLLTSLFIAAGSPGDLGRDSRPRPGCTPYIEYVTNFVLPRALHIRKEIVSLPFRTPSDKCRLISRALEVVETVIVRYTVPPPPPTSPVPPLVNEKKSLSLVASEASHIFGLSSLVEKIVVAPNENDHADFACDYRDMVVPKVAPTTQDPDATGQLLSPTGSVRTQSQFSGGEPPVPRAKSPGFTVLTELLFVGRASSQRIGKGYHGRWSCKRHTQYLRAYGIQGTCCPSAIRPNPSDSFECACKVDGHLSYITASPNAASSSTA